MYADIHMYILTKHQARERMGPKQKGQFQAERVDIGCQKTCEGAGGEGGERERESTRKGSKVNMRVHDDIVHISTAQSLSSQGFFSKSFFFFFEVIAFSKETFSK